MTLQSTKIVTWSVFMMKLGKAFLIAASIHYNESINLTTITCLKRPLKNRQNKGLKDDW